MIHERDPKLPVARAPRRSRGAVPPPSPYAADSALPKAQPEQPTDRSQSVRDAPLLILRRVAVLALIGLSRTSLWRRDLPAPVRLGGQRYARHAECGERGGAFWNYYRRLRQVEQVQLLTRAKRSLGGSRRGTHAKLRVRRRSTCLLLQGDQRHSLGTVPSRAWVASWKSRSRHQRSTWSRITHTVQHRIKGIRLTTVDRQAVLLALCWTCATARSLIGALRSREVGRQRDVSVPEALDPSSRA